MNATIQKVLESVIFYGWRIIAALAIWFVGKWIVGRIIKILELLLKKRKTNEILSQFFLSTIRIGLYVFIIVSILGIIGIQTVSFVAVFGAAGLAIGLALQGSLANVASGILLIIFRPYKIGDSVDLGGVMGKVSTLNILNTILKTADNSTIILPNSKVTAANIINYTDEGTRRIDLILTVGSGEDLSKGKGIVTNLLSSQDKILKEPAPVIGVTDIAGGAVKFAVRPWVKAEDYSFLLADLLEKIKLEFDRQGIILK